MLMEKWRSLSDHLVNFELLFCFKSLINMKNTHWQHSEEFSIQSHSEGKWKKPLEAARRRNSHNSFDLFTIILHGLALIAGRSFKHLNTILERQSDNHLVRIPRLLLTMMMMMMMIIASVVNVTAFLPSFGSCEKKSRRVQVTVIHSQSSLNVSAVQLTALLLKTEVVFIAEDVPITKMLNTEVYCHFRTIERTWV